MKLLVLGGTGAMGCHLVKLLAKDKHHCFITTRQNIKDDEFCTYLQGNAHDINWFSSIIKKEHWDAIVDFMGYNTPEFKQRYKLLLESTEHYIFLSSARVYAYSETPITEDSPRLLDVCDDQAYLNTDEYALSKARQEDILRLSGYSNYTIIRPYVTYSEIRLQLSPAEKEYWLYGALHGKTILFSKDIANKRTTLTYGQDVARGIISLIGKETAFGEAFHITSSETYTWNEILNNYLYLIESKKGKRPKVKMLDHWTPLIGGGATQVKWDRMYDRVFDNSKINKYIDINSFHHTLPTMAKCLSTFIDNPTFRKINWDIEAQKDRMMHEFTNFADLYRNHFLKRYIRIRFGL